MSDIARHDDLPLISIDSEETSPRDDYDLPLDAPVTARMALPHTARPATRSGKSDGAFERALEALQEAISDASAWPTQKIEPSTAAKAPTPVTRLMPKTAFVTVPLTVTFEPIRTPARTPARTPVSDELVSPTPVAQPAPRILEPKFLPQEDIGDGDPLFVTPEYERVPSKPQTQATLAHYVSRVGAARGFGIPPLLLAADAAIRIRKAARRVVAEVPAVAEAKPVDIEAKPVVAYSPTIPSIPVVTQIPLPVNFAPVDFVADQIVFERSQAEPVAVTTLANETRAETGKAANEAANKADEIDPFTLYPFGQATYRLLVM